MPRASSAPTRYFRGWCPDLSAAITVWMSAPSAMGQGMIDESLYDEQAEVMSRAASDCDAAIRCPAPHFPTKRRRGRYLPAENPPPSPLALHHREPDPVGSRDISREVLPKPWCCRGARATGRGRDKLNGRGEQRRSRNKAELLTVYGRSDGIDNELALDGERSYGRSELFW